MNNEIPQEGQEVRVKIGNGDWQSATCRGGQFVDLYGLPLDTHRVSEWQPAAPRTRTDHDDPGGWNLLRPLH
jgi:hypothetical protein